MRLITCGETGAAVLCHCTAAASSSMLICAQGTLFAAYMLQVLHQHQASLLEPVRFNQEEKNADQYKPITRIGQVPGLHRHRSQI